MAAGRRAAACAFGWTSGVMAEVACASLRAAWLGPDRGTRLEGWETEAAALLTGVRAPFGPSR